jgi:hypothetical protein
MVFVKGNFNVERLRQLTPRDKPLITVMGDIREMWLA